MKNSEISIHWPPTYSVKHSKRAKHISLRIVPHEGLVFIVPENVGSVDLTPILEDKKRWILKHLPSVTERLSLAEAKAPPAEIHLRALNEIWRVEYRPVCTRERLITRPGEQIVIMQNADTKPAMLLQHWLKHKAKTVLEPWLERVSVETGLSYETLNIRGQKRRWGSCSSDGNISLNYKLLFLPEPLVTHTLLHELCHTKHLNHGVRFWRLLAKHDPHWETHSQEVYKANHHVPLWLGE